MIQINLIPDALLKRRQETKTKQTVTQLFIAWIGILLVAVVLMFGWKLIQDTRLKVAKSNYNKIAADVNSPANVKFRQEALEVQASLAALDKLFNGQKKYSAVNSRLAALTPKTIVLQSLAVDNAKITITGVASSYLDIGKFVASLKNTVPSSSSSTSAASSTQVITFNSVVLAGVSASTGGVTFNITANYTYPAGGVSQ